MGKTRWIVAQTVMDAAEYQLMDQAEDAMWWYRALHTRLIDALKPVNGTVLDAGCGTGGFLAALRRARPDLRCIGAEWSETACRRATRKSAASIVRGSVNALPFASNSFDAVVLADVLCHAAVNPADALAECQRVMAPDGLLVINMPAYSWLMSAHDRRVHNTRRTTAKAIAALLTMSGYKVVTIRYWNSLLLPIMIAQRKLLARGEAASDVAAFPPWLDAIFLAVTRTERRLPFTLPVGGSILATARSPAPEPAACPPRVFSPLQ